MTGVLFLVGACASVTSAAEPRYRVVGLEHLWTLEGHEPYVRPVHVTNGGIVSGVATKFSSSAPVGLRPVRWDATGEATEVPGTPLTAGGWGSGSLTASNDSGVSVGFMEATTPDRPRTNLAYRWDAAGTPTRLGGLGSSPFAEVEARAHDVNAGGVAVGTVGGWEPRAVRWEAGSTVATDLGPGNALSINESGVAVGYWGGSSAARWNAGSTTAVILPPAGSVRGSIAWDVSDSGYVVGVGGSVLDRIALRWDPSGAATVLGKAGADGYRYEHTSAYSVNDGGVAVGEATRYLGNDAYGQRGVMWDGTGQVIDLNTLIDPDSGWSLWKADAINDLGWITGTGSRRINGRWASGAFLLIPLTAAATPGDANRDGRVDGDDYALLDRGAARGLGGWENGDFNGDGAVDGADYLVIDRAYAAQGGTLSAGVLAEREARFGAGYVQAVGIPEPGGALAVAGIWAGLAGRRRSAGMRVA
jgi:hypothetical protein